MHWLDCINNGNHAVQKLQMQFTGILKGYWGLRRLTCNNLDFHLVLHINQEIFAKFNIVLYLLMKYYCKNKGDRNKLIYSEIKCQKVHIYIYIIISLVKPLFILYTSLKPWNQNICNQIQVVNSYIAINKLRTHSLHELCCHLLLYILHKILHVVL